MTVSKYRRRPTVVEALCWHGWDDSSHYGDMADTEVELFVGQHNVDAKDGQLLIWVEKSRAWCAVDLGDYIIREPDGVGFYPCKADVFEASYEFEPEPPGQPEVFTPDAIRESLVRRGPGGEVRDLMADLEASLETTKKGALEP